MDAGILTVGQTRDAIIETLSHEWLDFTLEYTAYPLAVFILLFRMTRKEKPISFYSGLPKILEILARNWWELALTFFLSILLYEYRLYSGGLPLFDSSRLTSLYCIFLLVIYWMFLLTWERHDETLKISTPNYRKVVRTTMYATIPIIIFVQALLSCLWYFQLSVRLSLELIFIILSVLYFRHIAYTPNFWRELAFRFGASPLTDVGSQIKSATFLIKAYRRYRFDDDENYKFKAALECAQKVVEIHQNNNPLSAGHLQHYKKVLSDSISLMESTTQMATKLDNDDVNDLNDLKKKLKSISI